MGLHERKMQALELEQAEVEAETARIERDTAMIAEIELAAARAAHKGSGA